MAYREFDPAAMKTYQEKAIQMFNDQITAASTMITSKTNQKAQKEKDKAAAEKLAETAMMTVYDGLGILKEVPDTAKRAAEEAKAEKLGEEIEALEKEIAALNSAVDSLNSAITETTGYINGIMKSIEELDYTSENKIIELIAGINTYKRMLRNIYNTMDDTLVEHGYSRDVNIQQQFSNTLDDWGDSTVVNKFKYIPASYIYNGDVLNARILNGIFQKDLGKISLEQFRDLGIVLDNISDNEDLNSLSKFISASFVFSLNSGMDRDPLTANYSPVSATANLSIIYRLLVDRYEKKLNNTLLDTITSGTGLNSLSESMEKRLRTSVLLKTIESEIGNFDIARTIYDSKLSGIQLQELKNEYKLNYFTISKDDEFNGLKIKTNGGYKKTWYVSNFNPNFGTILNSYKEFQNDLKLAQPKVFLIDSITNYLIGLIPNFDKSSIIYDALNSYSLTQDQKQMEHLEGMLSNFDYGGIVVLNSEGDVEIRTCIMDLNESKGLGLAVELYNDESKTNWNASYLYNNLTNNGNFSEKEVKEAYQKLDAIYEYVKGTKKLNDYYDALLKKDSNLTSTSSYYDYQRVIEL